MIKISLQITYFCLFSWFMEPSFGRCHTFNSPFSLIESKWTFYFNSSIRVALFIHDPDYVLMTHNPATVPYKLLDLGHELFTSIYLEVTHQVKMNRIEYPCEANKTYSFLTCIMNWVSTSVGCRYIVFI